MYICDACASSGGNEYTLTDETGTKYTITSADLHRLGVPFSDKREDYPYHLADENREKLSFYADKLRCIKYLQYYISSYGAKSIRRLSEKCREKGYSNECIAESVGILCSFSAVDEKSDCERRISSLATEKLYGRYRIKKELISKGYMRENIEDALENCEIDFYANARLLYLKLIRRGIPGDIFERKKIADKMVRYGYSFDQIKYASSIEFEE